MLLTQIRQDGLVLKAVVVIVFLQFRQFRLALPVQLDLVESSRKSRVGGIMKPKFNPRPFEKVLASARITLK